MLSYLATESLVLELNQTRQLDYDMVARYGTSENHRVHWGTQIDEEGAKPCCFCLEIGLRYRSLCSDSLGCSPLSRTLASPLHLPPYVCDAAPRSPCTSCWSLVPPSSCPSSPCSQSGTAASSARYAYSGLRETVSHAYRTECTRIHVCFLRHGTHIQHLKEHTCVLFIT